MSIAPGEHADILRAVGRFLNGEGARAVELMNQDAFLSVSWKRGHGEDQRHYRDQELATLRNQAMQSRGRPLQESRGGYAEILRTLGQDLDQRRGDFTQIAQQGEEFLVSGSEAGRYSRRTYRTSDLLANGRKRKELRGSRRETSGGGRQAERWDDNGPLARRLG